MNQLESIYQRLVEKEANLRAEQKRKRHEKMAPKVKKPFRKLPSRQQLLERLLSYVEKSEGCWTWKGTLNGSGYGVFHFAKESLAHRISWLLQRGEIPDGMCVLHKCDNPPCVNPEHLFIGSHLENMQDCYQKDRWPGKILSDNQVSEIRIRHQMSKTNSGRAQSGFHIKIASEFGISPDYSRHITAFMDRRLPK